MYKQVKAVKQNKKEKEIEKMNNTENYASSINEALSDEKFLEKLRNAGSGEEIVKLFADEKGIEIDAVDAQDAFDKLESLRNGDELTAEELEYAAGGFIGCMPSPFRPAPPSGGGFNADVHGNGPRGPWGISIAIRTWFRR